MVVVVFEVVVVNFGGDCVSEQTGTWLTIISCTPLLVFESRHTSLFGCVYTKPDFIPCWDKEILICPLWQWIELPIAFKSNSFWAGIPWVYLLLLPLLIMIMMMTFLSVDSSPRLHLTSRIRRENFAWGNSSLGPCHVPPASGQHNATTLQFHSSSRYATLPIHRHAKLFGWSHKLLHFSDIIPVPWERMVLMTMKNTAIATMNQWINQWINQQINQWIYD